MRKPHHIAVSSSAGLRKRHVTEGVSASSDLASATSAPSRNYYRQLNLCIKRVIDISVSATALLILSPALLAVTLMIRHETPGPAFFSQQRWGRNGSTIRVLKFRTMVVDRCDVTGVRQTVINDARVTPLGVLLRRSNIDELPQLLNVLKGDMSLVGPRCHPIGMHAAGQLYENLVADYHVRHQMRPGMTGLAQINGYRGPTLDPSRARKRIQYDLEYVQNFSIWIDLKIIVRTILMEIKGGTGS